MPRPLSVAAAAAAAAVAASALPAAARRFEGAVAPTRGRSHLTVELTRERYGSTGPVTDPLPRGEQVHQLFPGADFALGERSVLDVGYGIGLTGSGNDDVLELRLGVLFGGRRAPGRRGRGMGAA